VLGNVKKLLLATRLHQVRVEPKWILPVLGAIGALYISLTVIGAVGVTFTPIFLILMAFVSLQWPRCGFFVLAYSMVVPDNRVYQNVEFVSVGDTSTTIVVAILALAISVRAGYLALQSITSGLALPVCLLVWSTACSFANRDTQYPIELAKCLFVGLLARFLVRAGAGDTGFILKSICFGLGAVLIVPPLYAVSFAVPPVVYESFGGFARLSLPRQDPNSAGLIFLMIHFISLACHRMSASSVERATYLALSVMGAVCAVLTQSRAAFLALGVVWIVMISFFRSDYLVNPKRALDVAIRVIAASCLAAIGMAFTELGQLFAERLFEMPTVLAEKGLDTRAVAATNAWEAIMSAPILGYGLSNFVNENLYVFAGIAWAHNTYLDVALASGIPGGICLSLICLYPLKLLWAPSSRHNRLQRLMIAPLFATLVMMMSLSMATDKLFWIFWFLITDSRLRSLEGRAIVSTAMWSAPILSRQR
jgi:O-antigen ligase